MTTGIELAGVSKRYDTGPTSVEVLRDVDLRLAPGDSLAVTGPSGSGKSTLLNILGTLDAPSTGSVRFGDVDPFALSDADLARFRNERVGFVFQDHHLLPQFDVLENVLLPSLAFPPPPAEAEPRARELLTAVGLEHRMGHRPAALSGGERQRTAVARALLMAPALILCDEPTGNLDSTNGRRVLDLLHRLHEDAGNTILVLVTHSEQAARTCARRLRLADGRCSEA